MKPTSLTEGPLVVSVPALADRSIISADADSAVLARIPALARVTARVASAGRLEQ